MYYIVKQKSQKSFYHEKIGIFKGIFDPISQRELKEALSWMKDEKLSFVVFEIENEATISISERKSLVKKAIKPYRKLLLHLF